MSIFPSAQTIWLFVIGFIIALPCRLFLLPISKKASNRSGETKWALNFILITLNMLIILGSILFTLYGNFLTSLSGSDNMTIDMFASGNVTQFLSERTIDFNQAFNSYMAFLYILLGIIVGIAFWNMIISLYKRFRNRNKPQVTDQSQQQPILVDNQKHNDTLKYIEEQRQAKTELDDFFNNINRNKPKE